MSAVPRPELLLDPEEVLRRYTVPDRDRWHLRANMIASLDGAATAGGLTGALNNPDDKLVLDTLRMLTDVLLVGAGTVREEGYGPMRLAPQEAAWRQQHGLPPHPVLALVSGRLDLDPEARVLTQAPVRPLLLTHAAAPRRVRERLARVADVVDCGRARVEPALVRTELEARGLRQVLCEGGPRLLGTLLEADLLDELCLTLSPALVGGQAPRIARGTHEVLRGMRRVHVLSAGDMLLLRYRRER
ncbi:pyrimidine reductase family protein [Ornithinicoccus halotolerans]|uniref:pyrimidine reductase family protein n=1 Tax=Ornithinicoccus halotolerans TaxID=1748220 RepID=UPI0012966008|nr:pyrimidine reductase family protein [Ornithinicoccus halotolerans]